MADDTMVAAKIINEQVQYSFQDSGFSYGEDEHLNITASSGTPLHSVLQGTFTESYSGLTISGKFTFTDNNQHYTSIADYSYTFGGNTYEYKSSDTSNGGGYNIIEQRYINGDPLGVFHYNG